MIAIYFSGTGNTEMMAKHFMECLGYENSAYSIEDDCVQEKLISNDTIVVAYPVYYNNIPLIFRDFLKSNKEMFRDKRVFVIATMALFSGDGAGFMARLLESYGARVIGGLHLRTLESIADEPFLKYDDNKNRRIIENAKNKVRITADDYKNGKFRQDGLGNISRVLGYIGQRAWFPKKTLSYSDKVKINQKKCISCGLCKKLCPMNNFDLVNGKYIPLESCTLCYRCVNRCPGKAITILGKKVYQQNDVDKINSKDKHKDLNF